MGSLHAVREHNFDAKWIFHGHGDGFQVPVMVSIMTSM